MLAPASPAGRRAQPRYGLRAYGRRQSAQDEDAASRSGPVRLAEPDAGDGRPRAYAALGRGRVRFPSVTDSHDPVIVIDFGAQYAQLIARRVRKARVFS